MNLERQRLGKRLAIAQPSYDQLRRYACAIPTKPSDHRQRIAAARAGAAQQRLHAAGRELVARHRGNGVLQRAGVDEPVEQRAALHAAPRQAEHVLERGVGEDAAPLGRDHRHQGGEVVEGGVGGVGRGRIGRRRRRALPHEGGSLPISRLIAAMSLSLRAIAAFISATRSWYFW